MSNSEQNKKNKRIPTRQQASCKKAVKSIFSTLSILIALLYSFTQSHAATYYSGATGALNLASSWWSARNGTGTHPSNFNGSDIFQIINNTTPTLTGNWNLGSGASVVLGDSSSSITFVIPNNYWMQGQITVTTGATLDVKNNNCPTINSCQIGSTVEFSGSSSQTIAVTSYYNLTVNNSNGIDLGTRSADTVRGTLNFISGSLTLNTSRLVLTGNVTGMNGTNCFTGNSGGTGTGPDVFILSSGAAGTIYFDQSTFNNSDRIDSFLVGPGSSVIIGNRFTIRSDYVLNGTVDNNGNTIYVRGNISGAGTETGSGCDSMVSTTSTNNRRCNAEQPETERRQRLCNQR